MELASGLLKEDPDLNRLVYASNPILTCAQLSFLLKNLAERFRFIQNDLEVLSQKLQNVAFHLQHGYRENNLYSLYLKALPTGLTMLDYIMQMGMKDLVETKFTKGLVLELWDNDSLVTGSKKQISSVYHSVQLSKKFQWKPNFVPKLSETFSFEFGNVITSAKYLLGTDLAFLMILYIILDVYIYDKISFFASAEKDPTLIYNIPDYTFDVCYHLYPFRTVFLYILLLNYWVFFGVRTIHIFRESRKRSSYSTAYLSSFLLLTLTLISILIFPSYESQLENHIFIKLILVFTRTAIAFTIGTSLLGFQKSGQTITVVATVTTSLCVILGLLVVVILLIAEVMNNFFRKIYWFSSVKESFFTLVEILFGSITFINQHDVEAISNIYYTSNMFILIYSFVSTLLTTFLLIAYLTSIYEAVRTEASYFNTLTQYNYMQIYANLKWKGFITFPPVIYVAVLPLFLIQRIQRFAESTNELLMKAVFFMTWVFFQVMKYIVLNSFYHGPILYFKNLMLICSGKMNVSGSKILHFVGWLFGGVFAIGYYMFIDLKVLLKVCVKDFSITPPQEKLLLRVTDDDVIYLQRYESLRAGLLTIMKENPDIKNIQYLELLNFLMNGGKIKTSEVPRSVLIKKETGNNKQRLVELIRKHAKRLGGSKWLKSIYDAKKKFYRELLDGFLSYKTRSMKIEDATIDPKVVLEMLAEVSEENIVYVRARQIFAIQLVLLNTQSKEQISTMNKIEELEKKIDNLFRIYVQLYGENKDFKWSRIIDVAKEQKSNPSAAQSVPQDNMEGGRSTVQYSAAIAT